MVSKLIFITLGLVALTPLQVFSAVLTVSGSVCVGERFVLRCNTEASESSSRDLVWGITGVERARFTIGTHSPGAFKNYTFNGAIRGIFELISISEGINSTFTLFDIGTAFPSGTEVYCHGTSVTGNAAIFIDTIGQITAPTITDLIPLNISAVQVNLQVPGYGTECITGYSVEVNGIISNDSGTELILNGLNVCDATFENITARAYGTTLQGDPAIISTQFIGGQDLLVIGTEDFRVSYQLLRNEEYNLNISVNLQTTSLNGLNFQAAVSESSNPSDCQAYNSFTPSTGYHHQLSGGPELIGRNLTVCISSSSQNCNKTVILTFQVSPIEIILSTTLGPSSASVTGRVDLSKVQASHDLLQVTGVASSAGNGVVYTSPTAEVEQDGSFTVIFLGLPPSGDFTYSVKLSLRGMSYGSVSNVSLPLRTAAREVVGTASTTADNSTTTQADNSISIVTPAVALFAVLVGCLSGTLLTLCMMFCLKRVHKQRHNLLERNREGGRDVEMEPTYEVVTAATNKKADDGMDFKTNEAYGSGKFTESAYATVANGSAGGDMAPMERIRVASNQAYGHVVRS